MVFAFDPLRDDNHPPVPHDGSQPYLRATTPTNCGRQVDANRRREAHEASRMVFGRDVEVFHRRNTAAEISWEKS